MSTVDFDSGPVTVPNGLLRQPALAQFGLGGSLHRIRAIVLADVRIRFRRLSTLVIFLLLSAMAYAWVPAPASGRALMQVEGKRAIYNSAAVGMATAALATIFIGLIGFYVISNAIGRDARSRCGFVIASTNVSALEYLTGKFAGNVVFLATFTLGFMCSSMAMVLVRGEAPLQPLLFAKQYALVLPSSILFVSALALVFESIPFLSGRFGDVAYFFVWASLIGVVGFSIEHGGSPGLLGALDISGLGFMFSSMSNAMHTTHMSIGASPYDPSKGTYVFAGLTMSHEWIAPRLASLIIPAPLILVARMFFHRFDPVRVKQTSKKRSWALLARINQLFKPLTRSAMALMANSGNASLLRSALADALLTITATPVLALVVIGTSIAALSAPLQSTMPIVIAAMGIAIADVACREARAGAMALTFAAPLLKPRFVAFKLLSSLFALAPFAIAPLVRMSGSPKTMLAFLGGTLFIAASATLLGLISGNAKTFIVLFLSFWYVAVNDKGATPGLDFAGFNSSATFSVIAIYAAITIAVVIAAQAVHSWRLRSQY
jgi:hypothetical protein